MAICRCHNCLKPTQNVTEEYVANAHPIGYPDSAIICGTKDCYFPAVVWLTKTEEADYQKGKRIFEIHTNKAKVRVI